MVVLIGLFSSTCPRINEFRIVRLGSGTRIWMSDTQLVAEV